MSTTTHIVIGTGPLGREIARQLVDRAESVVTVSRSAMTPVEGAIHRALDALDRDALDAVMSDGAVVYHCAQPPYHRWSEEFPPLTTAILAATARVHGRLVLADNLYAYDPRIQPITEHSPEAPPSRKGAVRASMAREVLDAHARGDVRAAVVRAADYFGPGHDQSSGPTFGRAAAGRAMRMLGSLDHPHSFTFVPDMARAMVTIGVSDDGWGRTWIAPVQPPITQRDFADAAWVASGRPGRARIRRIGPALLAVGGVVSPTARAAKEIAYQFVEPFVADPRDIETTLGVHPTPFSEAVAETARHYAQPAPRLGSRPTIAARAWRRLVAAMAVVGTVLAGALITGAALDIARFDQTSGGYEAPYTGWTGTPIDWTDGAVTGDGFLRPGLVIDTYLNCETGMISFELFGARIDFRVVSERAVAVHRPIEACLDAGFTPDFTPFPGA